jgi:phosphatidylglycerol:prolipoprotein diacylglycerol transferase
MLPALHVRLGHVHVVLSTYSLCIAIGVGAAIVLAMRRARRPDVVLVAASLAVVAGVVGSEVWHRLVHQSAGLSSMGGIAAGLAVVVVVARAMAARPLEVLDALAPGTVLGFGIGRIGCWLAGCCYGTPADLPWAVAVERAGPMPRHPVQLYEAAADVAIAVALTARADAGVGRTAARAMVGYGLTRIVVEVWRDPASADLIAVGVPSVAQLCGTALVLTGFVLHRSRPACAASPRGDSARAAR